MKMERFWKRNILAASVALALAATAPAAQERTLTFAGGPQGSVNYIIASGIGTVLSRHTDIRVTVVPYQGTTTLLPAVARGEPPIAANDAGSVQQGFTGTGQFSTAHDTLRLLSSGSMNHVAIAVRADSDIHSVADLRGKRITAQFAALPVCRIHGDATMANIGLEWSDVRAVPVTNIIQAAQALAENRVDAMLCAAPGIAALREIHARTPLRFIGVDGSPEAMERANAFYIYEGGAETLPAGAFGWLPNETAFLAYPWYLYAHEGLSDDLVADVLGVMWQHNGELRETHPIFRGWTTSAMMTEAPIVPYHSGAIAFYRSVGAWTEAAEAGQSRFD